MRCVTDTNIVVSGLLWLDNPGRLLEAVAHGRITLYASPVLVAELRSTLSYDRLAQRVERSGLTLDELLARYLNFAIVVEPATAVPITRDPDLLTLKTYQDIPIITAAEALRRIEVQR